MVEDLTGTRIRNKQMRPLDVAPKVQQQQSQSDKEQAQRDGGRGGAGAHGVHQAIAGLNPEARAKLFKDLLRRELQVTDDEIGKMVDAVPPIAALTILAHDPHTQHLLAIQTAQAGVGRAIALASDQQGPRAAGFAPNGQRNDGWKGLTLEEVDHGVVVEPSIQVQAFEVQPQLAATLKQPLEHVQHFVRAPHQCHRQRVALVVLDRVQGSIAMKVCRPAFGASTPNAFVIVLVPPVVGNLGNVNGATQRPVEQLPGQAGHQQPVDHLFQFRQAPLISHQMLHRLANRVRAGRVFQQLASHLYRHPFHCRRDQHIPDVLCFVGAAAQVQIEVRLQRLANQLVNLLRRQLLGFRARMCTLGVSHFVLLQLFGQTKGCPKVASVTRLRPLVAVY